MNWQLAYVVEQDRLCLTVVNGHVQSSWWLTRRMTLKWVEGWMEKLAVVNLPLVSVVEFNFQRDLECEHALSLEVDGPVAGPAVAQPAKVLWLQDIVVQVSSTGSLLQLSAQGVKLSSDLSRKESHALIELLARKCRQAGWLKIPEWPAWLGRLPDL